MRSEIEKSHKKLWDNVAQNWKKVTDTLIELLDILGLSESQHGYLFNEKKNISHKICREERNTENFA